MRFSSPRSGVAPSPGHLLSLGLALGLALAFTGALAGQASPPADRPAPRPPAAAVTTIVLDPGHGGEDSGVTGPGGTVEKDLTLAVARRLKTALETFPGFRAILTRDDDQSLSLDDRAAFANHNRADLFLSLHANASPRPTVTGTTIYITAFDGAGQPETVPTPERVPVVGGGLRDLELVAWNLAQRRFLPQSAEAARLIAQRLIDIGQTAPTVSSAPLGVLTSANMPALLIEMGYLSNVDQEAELGLPELQTAFAMAVAEAVAGFRSGPGRAGTP